MRQGGYHSPGSFRGLFTHTFSTRQLLLAIAAVAGGVVLLTWWLAKAKGAA